MKYGQEAADKKRQEAEQKEKEEAEKKAKKEEAQLLAPWLAKVGLADQEDVVAGWVAEKSALADLRGMLEAEQEDEE
eukprot:COSAG04_NODE_12127_length_669_cov_0.538596_2_plen_76_part_01